jgi:hypothetical protein
VTRGANLKRLRAKYAGKQPFPKPDFVDAQRWAIFSAYCHGGLSTRKIGENAGVSTSRVRSVLREVDAQLDSIGNAASPGKPITLDSRIEDLGLSSRARNALGGLGCNRVQDVLALDLSGSPGIGLKTRGEVLAALQNSGLRHPELGGLSPEMQNLDRSLERIHGRISVALGVVAKEIALLQKRLRKQMALRDGRPAGGADPA